MKLKTILRKDSYEIKLTQEVILLYLTYENKELILHKIFINKSKFKLFLNKLENNIKFNKKDFPKIREIKSSLNKKERECLISNCGYDLNSFNDLSNSLEEFNKFLLDKVVVRNSIGFRIVESNGLKLIFKKELNFSKGVQINNTENFISENWSLRVYNVGQANCSCLLEKEIPHTLFDIGCARRNYSLQKLIRNLNNANIIISHFDSDHINYFHFLFNQKNEKINIYFPFKSDLNFLPPHELFVILSSMIMGYNLIPVNLTSDNFINASGIKIYQGHYARKVAKFITIQNAESLICYFKLKGENVLIPGDALYDNFPIKFEATYLIAPHHGCKYQCEGKLPNIDEDIIKNVFIFCGPNKKYHHPNLTHIKHFKKENTIVCRFNNPKADKNIIFENDDPVKKELDFTDKKDGTFKNWL